MRTRAERAAARLVALGLAALAAAAQAQAQAQTQAQPADAPVPGASAAGHGMLEDPFNRAFLLDELEIKEEEEGTRDLAFDATLWAGYAFDRLLVRTEGEKSGGTTERAELELLWARSFARWWDFVAGARTGFAPGSTKSSAAFGIRGLAPYRFEVEATAYVGDGGRSALRFEGEYELLIVQRLVLAPQIELDWHGQSDPGRGTGAGLSSTGAALRLRYEIRREVAPYVGLVHERKIGRTADMALAAGEDPDDTRLVAGIRLRF